MSIDPSTEEFVLADSIVVGATYITNVTNKFFLLLSRHPPFAPHVMLPSSKAHKYCTSLTTSGAGCARPVKRGHKCAQHLKQEDGLRIGPSRLLKCGWGLFTTVARVKGERIASYTGERVSLEDVPEDARDQYGGEYVLQLSQTQFIDAVHPRSCAGRYSNTARAWNVARKECRGNNAHFTIDHRAGGCAWITATRKISAGEEVLTAYGRSFRIALVSADEE